MPSTWSCAKQIISNDGLGTRGLLKGLTATLGRHGLFNAVYFGSYHNLKRALLSPEVSKHVFAHMMGVISSYNLIIFSHRIQYPYDSCWGSQLAHLQAQ